METEIEKMHKKHITLLKHELKSLIKGSIKKIGRFDEILNEIEQKAHIQERMRIQLIISDNCQEISNKINN